MMQVVRGALLGAVMGAVLGALARGFMHLAAVGRGVDPVFDLGAAIAVASLFVLAGAGAGAARSLDLRGWQAGLIVVASWLPVLVVGGSFARDEIDKILAGDFTPPWTIELVAMVAVIVGLVLVTPYAGWRAARPPRERLRRPDRQTYARPHPG